MIPGSPMSDPSQAQATDESAAPKVRVLLVDDQPIVAEAIRRLLGGEADIEFHAVTDPTAALAAALRLQPSVILQDLVMPVLDGFALIGQYRAEAALREVPVVVLSSRADPELMARSVAVGASDYLVKLPGRADLLACLPRHAAAYRNRPHGAEPIPPPTGATP